jgi:hypothetical protein
MKKILIALIIVLIGIQLIRPNRNSSAEASPNDIAQHFAVPGNVTQVLKENCYDCHSNNTNYPWYTNIQPVGWWMQHHVNDGKEELNFSEFGTYKPKRQAHKMEEIAELVGEGEMPLKSYTWMHKNAVLNQQQKEIIIKWAKELQVKIETEHNIPSKNEERTR